MWEGYDYTQASLIDARDAKFTVMNLGDSNEKVYIYYADKDFNWVYFGAMSGDELDTTEQENYFVEIFAENIAYIFVFLENKNPEAGSQQVSLSAITFCDDLYYDMASSIYLETGEKEAKHADL